MVVTVVKCKMEKRAELAPSLLSQENPAEQRSGESLGDSMEPPTFATAPSHVAQMSNRRDCIVPCSHPTFSKDRSWAEKMHPNARPSLCSAASTYSQVPVDQLAQVPRRVRVTDIHVVR